MFAPKTITSVQTGPPLRPVQGLGPQRKVSTGCLAALAWGSQAGLQASVADMLTFQGKM